MARHRIALLGVGVVLVVLLQAWILVGHSGSSGGDSTDSSSSKVLRGSSRHDDPPLAYSFVDMHEQVFPWEHNNNTRRGWQGPIFFNADHSGNMSYLNFYHYGLCRKYARKYALKRIAEKPETVGVSHTYCDRPYEWGMATMADDKFEYIPIPAGGRNFRVLDDLTSKPGKDPDETPPKGYMDVHSAALVDFDRDGRLDLYVSTTTVKATTQDEAYNAVYWGTGALPGEEVGPDNPTFQFSGGRHAAEESGIEYLFAESRHLLVLDWDLNGALDLLLLAKPSVKMTFDIIASELYLNKGAGTRHFQLAPAGLTEFCSTALQSDIDGDGWAREIMLWRMKPPLCANSTHIHHGRGKDVDQDIWGWWCHARPATSIGIYTIHTDGTGKRHDSHTRPMMFKRKVEEWASADIDGDGLADQIMLQVNALTVFASSLRRAGRLPTMSSAVVVAQWNKDKCTGISMVVADFNLDGYREIFVLCKQPGTTKLYSRRPMGDMEWPDEPPSSKKKNKTNTQATPKFADFRLIPAARTGLHGRMPANATIKMGSKLKPAWKGVSVTDVNNDGFPDLYLAADGPSQFLINQAGVTAASEGKALPNYVALRLVGNRSNTEAIGATVIMLPVDGPVQVHEVRRAERAHGFDDERVVFGLGVEGGVKYLNITWPDGKWEVYDGATLKLNEIKHPNIVVESTGSGRDKRGGVS